jgi:hypothetical protein
MTRCYRSLLSEDPIGLEGGINLYQFAGGDPINFSDPFGTCPQNIADGYACLDFFIPNCWTSDGPFGFKGDCRDFDPNASPEQSRVQIVINLADGSFDPYVSQSCTRYYCRKAWWNNRITVSGGGWTVRAKAENSAMFGLAPAINATITLTPNGWGGWTTSGDRDFYPNLGIYYRTGGSWTTLNERYGASPAFLLPTWPNDVWGGP